jgi:chromosome segregation protein
VALLAGQAGDLQTQIVQHRQHRDRIDDEIALYQSEMQILDQELESLEDTWRELCRQAEEAERICAELTARMEQAEREARLLEMDRARLHDEHTAAKIAFAQIDERLGAQRARLAQLDADLDRAHEESRRIERHQAVLEARLTESRLAMLAASAEIADSFQAKEYRERLGTELTEQRDRDRERRRQLLERLQGARAASQDQLANLHERELALRDLNNEQKVLVDRLREDYSVDLGLLNQESLDRPTPEGALDAAAAEREMAEVRERMTKLGKNVNLDSIAELAEVEGRARELQVQHDDLTQAQASLQEIIARINSDSRKLFTETYDAVRAHFQDLFRKLFGGGMADVVLENPEDVLESGIEVVARPPGKELRSISLLSGGEKTLTAVALLLAIFRSKPSPFCLLDEVDAALDEANTTRLSSALHEFLDRSQFIVITHKKRTMAAADVLYGITMQESGISKQVSVQFEDWPDEEDQREAA